MDNEKIIAIISHLKTFLKSPQRTEHLSSSHSPYFSMYPEYFYSMDEYDPNPFGNPKLAASPTENVVPDAAALKQIWKPRKKKP